jgi:hypothetical protein
MFMISKNSFLHVSLLQLPLAAAIFAASPTAGYRSATEGRAPCCLAEPGESASNSMRTTSYAAKAGMSPLRRKAMALFGCGSIAPGM